MDNQLTGEKTYYVYRHIRLDKNEPFYIGKGTAKLSKTTDKSVFHRAYNSKDRSIFWKKIVAKTNYEVEIIFCSSEIKEIQKKEKEFIKLYGRRDLGLGPLCNLTDGGETEAGAIRTEEQAKKWMEAMKGKYKKGGESCHAIPVFAYTLDGSFHKKYPSMTDAAIDIGIMPRTVSAIAGRNRPSKLNQMGQRRTKGFTFFLDYRGEFFDIPPRRKRREQGSRVAIIDNEGNIIKTFRSLRKAYKETGDARPAIKYAIRNNKPTVRGNRYKFIN